MHRIQPNLREVYRLAVRKMSSETFKGVPLSEIYGGRDAFDLDHLPPIANKRDHTVLYKLPITMDWSKTPEPYRGESKWDHNHVRMPYAPQSDHKSENSSNPSEKLSTPRWDIIQKALLREFRSTRELENAIKLYNPKYARDWKFKSLHEIFDELDEPEVESFLSEVLPFIIGLALQLPDIVPCALPLLKHGQNRSISLSQEQIASLLANAFLCTFPRRNDHKQTSEYAYYPSINFSGLFRTPGYQNMEKIRCICSYFRRIKSKMPTGVVTFTRRSLYEGDFPDWADCTDTFDTTPIHVSDSGTIEENGKGMLQVDFANKFLGGGVLNYGCVQEEIRFVICPELLVSRLFTECLDDNECMVIMGCERFNAYTGYASTFTFTGDIVDETPYDSSRRRKCTIVAIDAVPFSKRMLQYREHYLKRELNKAYVGFKHDLPTAAPGVATGNWGCGAFGGDKLLKSLLQLMACCVTKRPLVYYTFGDTDLRDDFFNMYEYLSKNKVTVGELWHCLRRYASEGGNEHLYECIMSYHMDLSERQSQASSESSTQSKSSKVTIKPKRIEPAKKSPKQQPSKDDRMEYDIEDPDVNVDDSGVDGGNGGDGNDSDDQYTLEEVCAELSKSEAELTVKPKYKSLPIHTSSAKNSPLTIRNFFQSISKPTDCPTKTSTPESQEKRPRSALVSSLDNDYNRKYAKIEREHDLTAAQKCDTDTVAVENQEVSPTGGHSATPTPQLPTPPQDQCLENEQMEVSEKKKKSKSDLAVNPFATQDYNPTPMDQDGGEINSENSDSVCYDLNATRWIPSDDDMFDESMESPKIPKPNNDDSSNTKNSPTPSKVNDRPRGQFRYQEPRSTEQSSPSSSTVHSAPSSEDILTQSDAIPNINNDQENSDLNTEADHMKALNVTSDK